MKTAREMAQMEATAAALASLMRVILDDSRASVEFDGDAETLRLESEAMCREVNVRGDNARAAVYDFVRQTIGEMIL